MKFRKAHKQFEFLIKFVARRFAVPGHFRLSKEDLIAEGMLVLVRCCRDFPSGKVHFANYFKRSLFNHMNELHRFDRKKKRRGIQVPLTDNISIVSKKPYPLDQALHIAPELSPLARRYLLTLVLLPPEVCAYALKAIGPQRVLSLKEIRVRPKHIRGYLGMSSQDVRDAIHEIRDVHNRQPQA